MTENKLNVFPSRMVLTGLKDRVTAAKMGYSLLKRKSDAIKANLNLILKEILDIKRKLFKTTMREAAFAHTEATYYADNFNSQVIENTKMASYRIRCNIKNVAGVKLPVFQQLAEEKGGGDMMVGLSRGGDQILECKKSFTTALLQLVRLASLQTSLKTLDDALKITNRRVNALEFVVMPILENTQKYVIAELDELEREDTYRIKKVKDLRVREAEAAAEAQKAEDTRRRRLGLPTASEMEAKQSEEQKEDALSKFSNDAPSVTDDVSDML